MIGPFGRIGINDDTWILPDPGRGRFLPLNPGRLGGGQGRSKGESRGWGVGRSPGES